MSKIGSLLSFVQKSFVECLGFFCTMVGNRWYDMVMISYLGINLYSGIKGDRGSGVIFACYIQMKFPIAGVSMLFME